MKPNNTRGAGRGRRRKSRRIGHSPTATLYKPRGIPMSELTGVVLPADAMEAMRLVDAVGLSQQEAADAMGVSRPTVCRMVGTARRLVATALAEGKAIRIAAIGEELGEELGEEMGEESGEEPEVATGQTDAPCAGKGPGRGRGSCRCKGRGKGRDKSRKQG